MAVSDALQAQRFGLSPPFVEIRFFHNQMYSQATSLLFGLVETAAKPEYAQNVGEKVRKWKWPEGVWGILQYLMDPEVEMGRKQALWGEELVTSSLMMAIDETYPSLEVLKSDIEQHFGLRFRDYYDGFEPSEDVVTLYRCNIEGKEALLYQEYSSESFGMCTCGYLYYKFGVYEKYQHNTSSWAYSLSQLQQSFPVSCLHCHTDVGFLQLTAIAESTKSSGRMILREIQSKRQGEKASSNCRMCGGRLELVDKEEACDCGKVCWNCVVVYSLKKNQFECPACRVSITHAETWNKMNGIRGKIMGLEGQSELVYPVRTQPFRPPSVHLCEWCKQDASERRKRDCGCLFCSRCTETFLEKCPKCSQQREEEKKEEIKSSAAFNTCSCGKPIEGKGIYCDNKCLCAACLLKHYLTNRTLKCPICHDDILNLIALDVLCSECYRKLQPLELEALKHPSALCSCGAILCCFCIKFSNDSAICPLTCKGSITMLYSHQEIQEKQANFPFGCYCGGTEAATCHMPCGHNAHQQCAQEIFRCRICGESRRSSPKTKRLDDYLIFPS